MSAQKQVRAGLLASGIFRGRSTIQEAHRPTGMVFLLVKKVFPTSRQWNEANGVLFGAWGHRRVKSKEPGLRDRRGKRCRAGLFKTFGLFWVPEPKEADQRPGVVVVAFNLVTLDQVAQTLTCSPLLISFLTRCQSPLCTQAPRLYNEDAISTALPGLVKTK